MKKVRIVNGKVGLVFRKGNYLRVIKEGVYWLRISEEVYIYDLTNPFKPSNDLNILLKDKSLAEMLIVVEVKDNEIVIQYQNGNFKNILMPGRYAFWKGVTEYSFTKADLSKYEITEEISESILVKPEVLQFVRVFSVESFEKGILIVNGKMKKVLEPGVYMFWKNSTILSVQKSDLRQQQIEISGQEILTKDKAALRINFFAKYKTVNIEKALTGNKEFEKQLYILMQLSLREYIGTFTLDELLENKVSVSEKILNSVKEKAEELGVEILDCGIRDVILPGEVKEIMNQVLIAEKKAQANNIARREETASTRSLLNTAKLMEDNAMLFRLKEMEYMEKIADKINTISISGGNQVLEQMKTLFSASK
ncbi:MAG: peptidase [Bacteroidetes bacterium HGW-Bacteroidetes-21]|jgi:regulator of protease activity HflC (stomatin/prohibitin superfamily)|nr:MAG: peptidase [Bacteroidetes bacterium HGW-Bacteroidetes-21]